jgi:hypothetical protein
MNELITLPVCSHKEHGQMEIRPIRNQTYEQKFCGTWYDCMYPGCKCSSLFPSKELLQQIGGEQA